MFKKILFYCLFASLLSCAENDSKEKEITAIPIDLELKRFDQRFANATADSLPALKKEFSFLFPRQYPDILWVQKMEDTIQLELNEAVATQFPDLRETEDELEQLFQHIKYYFPQRNIPKVITLTSDVDYRNQVVWADSLLLVALDTYLGMDHPLYTGVQDYIKKEMQKDQIAVDAAGAFAQTVVPGPSSRSFLAHMVYYGKMLYLKDILLPFKTDAEKMTYLPEEFSWAQANEDQIWRYFVERELLYSSDSDLQTRFLYPAPFSKFFLELDAEAPPRLGQFLGWQIVQQFMEKKDVSVKEMIETDAETIFKKSKYKPRK
ncbi:gliding motility lipoprotein GldB [Salinimicrobium sp. MT39]|uniref:Gliding motility lipoprotein GldB n=1 Tax=Salinimicrobium profundisediminis TaxID=2994553 RepID=A0A9X3CWV5_9FLAO|nr:gliding motility lipoprotein GldB [Salinimicrobium profundisediminis]MCX2838008.1 gliding motility lipoprotein GldB [Salinimicrobium profundisediminis]